MPQAETSRTSPYGSFVAEHGLGHEISENPAHGPTSWIQGLSSPARRIHSDTSKGDMIFEHVPKTVQKCSL